MSIRSAARCAVMLLTFLPLLTTARVARTEDQDTVGIEMPIPPGARPWTHLDFRNASDEFQFAVVSDLTAGNRTAVFQDAVRKLNLLRPEFVLSVGDLIEGYTRDASLIEQQWQFFENMVARLETPFFYVPGNHDVGNPVQRDIWTRRFGPTFYHFVYRNVLFLILDTEVVAAGGLGEAQESFVSQTLASNPQVRWTLVFMHRPLWAMDGGRRWSKTERMFKDRDFTVFAGHWHRYQKYLRDGKRYIHLGTTGGGRKSQGARTGAFDHITWITMTNNGPRIANIQVDGIWDEDVVNEASAAILRTVFIGDAVQIAPVFAEEETFTRGTSQLTIRNGAELPMTFAARFWQHAQLRPSQHAFDVVVPPKDSRTLPIDFTADHSPAVTDLEPVSLAWTIGYRPPGLAPLEIEDTLDLRVVRILPCDRRTTPVVVDGQLDDWEDFPFVCDQPELLRGDADCYAGPQDCSFRFNLQYDDGYLYFAAAVTDDVFVQQVANSPVKRDWLEVLIDARPDPVRSMFIGQADPNEILVFMIATTEDPTKPHVVARNRLPRDVQVASARTPTGMTVELAVPISYLDQKQGKPWSRLRLNMAVSDFDDPNRDVSVQAWWRPWWRTKESYAGSGTFAKRPAAQQRAMDRRPE